MDNIEYHGSFPVDEIPMMLDRGFGLVWDGDSIYGCQGQSGQYLRYNNPHKLSLYLSSGLPVVIWREAAEAKFVEENGVGILVDDLRDLQMIISRLSAEEWNDFIRNVRNVSKKLCNGFYASSSIQIATRMIE